MNPFLQGALQLALQGKKVFPCAENGKNPLTKHGFQDASSNEFVIRDWWDEWPNANVAIPTGQVNNLIVWDADQKDGKDGLSELRQLAKEAGFDLDICPQVRTPNNGVHFYCTHPSNERIGNRRELRPGVDMRGDGGYVLAPPSIIDGKAYSWTEENTLWDCIPEWQELDPGYGIPPEPQALPAKKPSADKPDDYSWVLERARLYLERIPGAISGSGGHDQTFWAACALVQGFDLQLHDAFDLLTNDYNPRCQPPWSDRELLHKVTDADRAQGYNARGHLRDKSFNETWSTMGSSYGSLADQMNQYERAPESALDGSRTQGSRTLYPLSTKGGGTGPNPLENGLQGNESRTRGSGTAGTIEIIEKRSFTLKDAWSSYFNELEKRRKNGFLPIETGICGLDYLMGGGFPAGQMSIVAAPPGAGKTSFVLDVGCHAARNKVPTLVWSIEMSDVDVYSRLVSLETGLGWGEIRSGQHNDQVKAVWTKLSDLSVHVADGDEIKSLEELRIRYEQMMRQFDRAPFVIVDYAQLVAIATRGEDVRHAAEASSSMLLGLSRKYGSAVVAVSSVSRAAYRILKKDGYPDLELALGVAKETGRFEYDSSCVLNLCLFPIDQCEDVETKRPGWICVSKSRLGGKIGHVPVMFYGQRGRYQECSEDDLPIGKVVAEKLDQSKDYIVSLIERGVYQNKNEIYTKCPFRRNIAVKALNELITQGAIVSPSGQSDRFRVIENAQA